MGQAGRTSRVAAALVAAQFSLIGLCLLPVGPTLGPGARGLGLALLGAAGLVGILAFAALGSDTRVSPVPAQGSTLRTSGIYRVIRHPMYAAVLLACLGVVVSSARVLALVALAALMIVLHLKAGFEDRLLRARYGASFDGYRARVPAILPGLPFRPAPLPGQRPSQLERPGG